MILKQDLICKHCGGDVLRTTEKLRANRNAYCQNCWKNHRAMIRSKWSTRGQETIYQNYINRWKAGLENGMKGKTSTSSHIREYLFRKYENACSVCYWHEKNQFTEKYPLEIHHADGDHTNNHEDNLGLLCPNCHSLTKTFRSRGKGRKARKMLLVRKV